MYCQRRNTLSLGRITNFFASFRTPAPQLFKLAGVGVSFYLCTSFLTKHHLFFATTPFTATAQSLLIGHALALCMRSCVGG